MSRIELSAPRKKHVAKFTTVGSVFHVMQIVA